MSAELPPYHPTREEQPAYRRRRLSEDLPILALPLDHPRPPVSAFLRDQEQVVLGQELYQQLKKFSDRHDCAPFIVFLAAFYTLLFRYTGESDLIVGWAPPIRSTFEVPKNQENVLHPLFFRTDLSDHPTVNVLLDRIKQAVKETAANGPYSLQEIADDRGQEYTGEFLPFRVMFQSEEFSPEFPLGKQTVEQSSLSQQLSVRCDLILKIAIKNRFVVHMEYDTELFEPSTIIRMLGHYQTLLAGMISGENSRIWEYALLSEAERHRLLVEWNQTSVNYPRNKCIHHLFESQVIHTPDAMAVVHGDQQLTYGELNRRANQLAHFLQKQGVGPDVRVGLCLERGLNMMIGLLGILKAGGAYVPLDPTYPEERLQYIINDSNLEFLVTQYDVVHRLGVNKLPRIHLDQDWPLLARYPGYNPGSFTSVQNLAYLIYTSGSTGHPKGVMVPHGGVVNLLLSQRERVTLDPTDVVLAVSSLSFDISVFELLGPLLGGGYLVLISKDVAMDGARVIDILHSCGITVMQATATMWHMLLQANQGNSFGHLKIISGGEPMTTDLGHRLQAWGSAIWNEYGPTETTIWSTIYEVRGSEDQIPIGRPLANTTITLLDHVGELTPIGITGEILIGGNGVARGYHRRPDLTAEKFIPDRFNGKAGARVYRTGDLGRYRSNGDLEYLGRLDNQVKVRGHRIELGEIETILEQQSSVRQAIVLVREDLPGDKQLVAYVVPAHDHAPKPGELPESLALTLPDYMIPHRYVLLNAFPLTPNGKVDVKSLPMPDQFHRTRDSDYIAPRTSLEKQLIEIWQERLRLDQIGIHDNFFKLGGNSLLATDVVGRTQALVEKKLSIRNLFEHPTVAQFAATLEMDYQKDSVLPLIPQKHHGSCPLSFAQQRLWFLEQWEPGNTAYLLSYAWRIRGQLDRIAIEASMTTLVARHESLRTACSVLDGQPVQMISLPVSVNLPFLDLTAMPGAMCEKEVRRLIQEDTLQPFDLTRSPLWRGQLIRVSPEDHVLLLSFHHLITDGWSMGIVFEEFNALYATQVTGSPNYLPPLPLQYTDYAMWQRNWLKGEALDRQVAYWRAQLADAPHSLELSTDYPRPPQLSYKGNSLFFTLSPSLTQGLNSLSRQEGVTLFMTLLAAFQVLLFRYTGQKDILIGSPIAGRTHTHLEHLIGYFANTLVLRTRFIGQPTFQGVLQQIKETCLNAYAHQDLPFEKVVETLQPVRDSSRHPIFQAMFQLDHADSTNELDLLNLDIVPLPQIRQTAKFDLSLGLVLQGGTLKGTVIFNTELFEPATIIRLNTHYQMLLESLVANPACPISQLPLLPETERHQLLGEWNPPVSPVSPASIVHEIFETQAAHTPDGVAIVCEDEHLTYEALNKKGNQLACFLVQQGVGPEVRVACYLDRSINLLIAILGILKAGGAYVPLDPSAPVNRITFLLADAQVRLVLTHSSLLKQLQGHNPSINVEPLLQPRWVAMDDTSFGIFSGDPSDPSPIVTADNLAYVIYTSGSTGQPKGVEITQANLSEFAQCAWKYLEIEPSDRVLQFASLSFDAAVEEIFPCLLRGATLVLRPENMIETVSTFWEAVNSLQLTVLDLPTAYWHELTNALSVQAVLLAGCVRMVVIGGEQARADQLANWQKHMPSHLKLLNVYGPTEATVGAALGDLSLVSTQEVERPLTTVSIGQSMANRSIYIVDPYLQLMPIGVPGELYLGGQGLGRGYNHRQRLTAEAFIPDPFSGNPGARLYRTGDRGRYRADGAIELFGRMDRQIKIRGYRIELDEIESWLRQIPEINDAVVIPQSQDQGDTFLVAYVVSHQHLPLSVTPIRNYLQEKLPHFMVPASIIQLEEFPRLPSGKINRKALSSASRTASRTSSGKDPVGRGPETAAEEILVSTWKELLHLPAVNVRDNFFELGGHSLLATRLLARLREIWQSDFPLRIIFDHPILEDQALVIEEHLLREIENLSEEKLQNILNDQAPQ